MPKPSEFYVGIVDFFAILVPGAIVAAILSPRIGPLVMGPLVPQPSTEVGNWAAFLTCSYFIGHLVFLAGSYVDALYNKIREKRTPMGNESAYQCATSIRDSLIQPNERKALNTFQCARSVLITKNPAAADDVHRLEADSKFFRSLLIVCIIAAGTFSFSGQYYAASCAVLIIAPCFARYYERRLKSTTQAYIHVVTMQRLGALSSPDAASPEPFPPPPLDHS